MLLELEGNSCQQRILEFYNFYDAQELFEGGPRPLKAYRLPHFIAQIINNIAKEQQIYIHYNDRPGLRISEQS